MIAKYPYTEIAEGIYEINEYDGVSMFLIIGTEQAFLVDTGVGIGNLKAFIERLTSLPYSVIITHNHRDHAGNAPQFEKVYMSRQDKEIAPIIREWTSAESRRNFARRTVAMHPEIIYPWNEETDIRDFSPCEEPEVLIAENDMIFELGGRKIKVVLCPGHTPGSLAVIDTKTHVLIAGDAVNYTVGIGVRPLENPKMQHVSVEKALYCLKKLSMEDYDPNKIFCAHSDFRGFGKPLKPEVMPYQIEAMQRVVQGVCNIESEYIPVLNLTVDTAVFEDLGIRLQFHKEHIQETETLCYEEK